MKKKAIVEVEIEVEMNFCGLKCIGLHIHPFSCLPYCQLYKFIELKHNMKNLGMDGYRYSLKEKIIKRCQQCLKDFK